MPFEEAVDAFFEQPRPAGFFVARIDREEQAVVRHRRFVVAGGVADHQRVVRPDTCLAAASASFLLPISWPQIATHVARDVVLVPLGFERLVGRLRADEHVGLLGESLQALRGRTGNGGTPRTMSAIALFTACDQSSACFKSGSPVSATAFSSAGLPSFDSRGHPVDEPLRLGDRDAAGLHFGPAAAANRAARPAPGKRFTPRLFEYRLTNSAASRAYLLTPCSS